MKYYDTSYEILGKLIADLKGASTTYTSFFDKVYSIVIQNEPIEQITSESFVERLRYFLLECCRYYYDGDFTREEIINFEQRMIDAHQLYLLDLNIVDILMKKFVQRLVGASNWQMPLNNLSAFAIEILMKIDHKVITDRVDINSQTIDLQGIEEQINIADINILKRIHNIVLYFIHSYNMRGFNKN